MDNSNYCTSSSVIKILFFVLISFETFSQSNYKREPFKKSNQIIITIDSTDKALLVKKISTVLLKNNFSLDKVYENYGSVTTNYSNSLLIQMRLEIGVLNNEIWVQGKYNSNISLGTQTIISSLDKSMAQNEGLMLYYVPDLKLYYDFMAKIANEIKESVKGKDLLHCEKRIE